MRSLLEEWKRRFPSTYRDAYASDAAAVLLAPFVRSELLQWGPLYGASGGGGFESQGWYKELFDFGADGEQARRQSERGMGGGGGGGSVLTVPIRLCRSSPVPASINPCTFSYSQFLLTISG